MDHNQLEFPNQDWVAVRTTIRAMAGYTVHNSSRRVDLT